MSFKDPVEVAFVRETPVVGNGLRGIVGGNEIVRSAPDAAPERELRKRNKPASYARIMDNRGGLEVKGGKGYMYDSDSGRADDGIVTGFCVLRKGEAK